MSKDVKENFKTFISSLGIETTYNATIIRLCRMFDGDGSKPNTDLMGTFIKVFLQHQKWHDTQASRCHQALIDRPKYAAKIKEALNEHTACLPSNLALLQCVQLSESFVSVAKQFELLNKLFGLVAPLFELDAEPLGKLEKRSSAD